MDFGGDPTLWSDFFPEGLIPEILNALLTCWDKLVGLQPDDHEVPITRRLREELRREKDCRRLPFSVWPESSEANPSTRMEIGRIDLRFLHGYREDVYLAFECKRLRIPGPSGSVQPNTSEYVGENGIGRHLSGKYSRGLNEAGMIGYVMDGKIRDARGSIRRALDKARQELRLIEETGLEPCTFHPMETRLAESRHSLPDRFLRIHHVFLAVR